MDQITETLSTVRDDTSLNSAVRLAAVRGIIMTNKYYSKTDFSDVYRVAMIMHPEHKTSYFRKQDWPEQWITQAVDIARDIWRSQYKPSTPCAEKSSNGSKKKVNPYEKKDQEKKNDDAFEEYISSPPLTDMPDPFVYWEGKKSKCPELAQMGFDYNSKRCQIHRSATRQVSRGLMMGLISGVMPRLRRDQDNGCLHKPAFACSSRWQSRRTDEYYYSTYIIYRPLPLYFNDPTD
ncbi:hypothetical protein VKT23_018727 [Stygiomarasmius scandens]|uniref:Uncharacterized protein n=1 Tax=Marasmiellus scandens TaxID=2682957 RepID=A0ABR1INC0_9AGAR